jgi:Tol biopolymer transport system component
MTPNRDLFQPEDMTLGNTKWHPGAQHLLVTMWVYPCPAARRSLYIVSRDGSDARWLTHFGHHHSWTPDGTAVLFNDRMQADSGEPGEPRMFLVDFDGSNRRVIFDQPVGSHPLMAPAGRLILDADAEGIYLVHLEEQRLERIATFGGEFDTSHHGAHPHPVWNHDGTALLYNSGETGHSEIHALALDGSSF